MPEDYYQKVLPAAKLVTQKLGLSESVAPWFAASWSWETGFDKNNSSKYNNHGGIKANSLGKDYIAPTGTYAGYNSIERFADDVARTLRLSGRGYENVLKVMKERPNDYVAITQAFNASKWAEADYNVKTIVDRAKMAGGVSVTYPTPSGFDLSGIINKVNTMDAGQLRNMAIIGAVAVTVAALVKE